MILIYVMVVFCIVAAIRQPAFISPATLINLCRAGIFTMCFAICEMIVIIPEESMYLSPQSDVWLCMCRCIFITMTWVPTMRCFSSDWQC